MQKRNFKTIYVFLIILLVLLFFYFTRSSTGYTQLEGIFLYKNTHVIICLKEDSPYQYYFLNDATEEKELFENVSDGDFIVIKCVLKNEASREMNVFECKVKGPSDEEMILKCTSFFEQQGK